MISDQYERVLRYIRRTPEPTAVFISDGKVACKSAQSRNAALQMMEFPDTLLGVYSTDVDPAWIEADLYFADTL